jgi:hypothetical protein
MKICQVAAELFHANGRTARHDEANSRFTQFCEIAYKTVTILCPSVRNILFEKCWN